MATGSKKKKSNRGRKPLGEESPLLSMGPVYPAKNKWRVVLATTSLYFMITPEIIARSMKGGGSGRFCVVALALEALFGKRYSFQVGTVYTKIWDAANKIEVRFRTPAALAKRIKIFDQGDGWQLPANIYRLIPMNPGDRTNAKNRRYSGKASATVRSVLKKTKPKQAAASRTVMRNTRIRWADVDLMG